MKRRKTYNKYDKSIDTPAPEPVETYKGIRVRKNITKAMMLSAFLHSMHEGYDYHTCNTNEDEEDV